MEKEIKEREYELRRIRRNAWSNADFKFVNFGSIRKSYLDEYGDNFIFGNTTTEQVLKALEGIANNDTNRYDNLKTVRNFSRYLFATDDAYARSLTDFAGSVLWVNTLNPLFDINDDTLNRYYLNKEKIVGYIRSAFDKGTLSEMLLALCLNGLYVGYEVNSTYNSGKNTRIQTLPIDYCRLVSKVDGLYEVQFDFSYFDNKPDIVLGNYPDLFKNKYKIYKDDTTKRWAVLPYNKTFVFTTPMELPLLVRSFKEILLRYKSDQFLEDGLGSENIKFVIQKIPVNKDSGEILANVEDVRRFHNNIHEKMPKSVITITSPYDIKPESYTENKMNTSEEKRRYIDERVYKSVGVSEASMGIAKAQSGYKIYINTLEARLNLLLAQFNYRITYQINNLPYKGMSRLLRWDYIIYPITTLNRDKWFENTFKMYKEGGSLALPYQIALGLDIDNIKGMLQTEKVEDFQSFLIPREKPKSDYEPKGGKEATTDDGESTQDRELGDEM